MANEEQGSSSEERAPRQDQQSGGGGKGGSGQQPAPQAQGRTAGGRGGGGGQSQSEGGGGQRGRSSSQGSSPGGDGESGGGGGVAQPPQKMSAVELIDAARKAFAQVSGTQPESVSGLTRQGDGWRVNLEVVEVSRIPPTTDILGSYEIELTPSGELAGYRRTRRYHRNQAEGGGEA